MIFSLKGLGIAKNRKTMIKALESYGYGWFAPCSNSSYSFWGFSVYSLYIQSYSTNQQLPRNPSLKPHILEPEEANINDKYPSIWMKLTVVMELKIHTYRLIPYSFKTLLLVKSNRCYHRLARKPLFILLKKWWTRDYAVHNIV